MLISMGGVAQTDSLEVHTIKGKEYYIHTVSKGESLYSIHKKYNIPLDVIKKENPGVADGLSIDEKVFIPVRKDKTTETITNGNYLSHTVLKKQTLYSIAKLYKVKQNELIAVNPEIEGGLKEGQVIKIPVKQLKEQPSNNSVESIKQTHHAHVVKKGETLYSLSKTFALSIEEIKKANNGLEQGLREGETIFIPKKGLVLTNITTTATLNVLDSLKTDSLYKKPIYNIGLLLPFYLDENAEMVENRSALEEKKIYPKSRFAIEFYNGLLMALDSIYSDSCKFNLFAYDTGGKDTARIKSLLAKSVFKNFDLIIGPLYYDNFNLVAEFGKEHNIPVVSPIKQSNKVLLGNPFIFKTIPSKTSIIDPLAKLVVDSFKTENLIAVSFEKAKEKSLTDLYIKTYNKHLLAKSDTSLYSAVKKLEINGNVADIVANLKANVNNVVFVPTSNQTEVTNMFSYLITTLNKRDYKDYRVTLIGLEEWLKFENIDLDYFQRLNVHYCASQFIQEDDSLTRIFINNYIDRTDVYPSKNAVLGYDLGCYFGNYFANNGNQFYPSFMAPYNGQSIKINFFKTGIESGFENTSTNLLRFYDYAIEKIYQ
jgi:LysM repeat protein